MTTDLQTASPGQRPASGTVTKLNRYTLHIDFNADSEPHAQLMATRFAEGLGRLRSEVDIYSARLSTSAEWGRVHPLFCGAAGPSGERCADEPDHGGYHTEGCVGGYVWSDQQPGGGRLV